MPLNTVYQLRARQTWGSGGKPLESVFFFDHTAGDGVAADLATAFGIGLGAAINALQAPIIRNYSIDVINLGDLGDFASLPWIGGGAGEGDSLPPYAAVGYTLKVNTRAVRKGSKRISGVPESVATNGVITIPGYQSLMDTLRIALQQEVVTADDTWLPVIVKRIKELIVGTVPPQYTYRLPTIGDTIILGEVVVALTSNNLTHQVSREV
jgi:hypothetical protein